MLLSSGLQLCILKTNQQNQNKNKQSAMRTTEITQRLDLLCVVNSVSFLTSLFGPTACMIRMNYSKVILKKNPLHS